ncbi:MAG TPA: hypothetical protein VGG25_19070 [Streptosporangiaceae bacterium]
MARGLVGAGPGGQVRGAPAAGAGGARAEPAPRKTPERRSARLEPFKAVTGGWLRDDLDAPLKQRHTATRIHARPLDADVA